MSLHRRVTLALLVSLAIHLATLAGLNLRFEHLELSETSPLAVRILPLAPLAEPETRTAPARLKRALKPLPKAVAAAPAPAPMPSEPMAPAPSPAESTASAPAVESAAPAGPIQARAAPATPETGVSGRAGEPPVAFPERIELQFDIAKNDKEGTVGRIVHRFEREGTHYAIQSVSTAAGIAALFATGRYVQESRGILTPQGLQPEQFVVRRGRVERSESAAFDWAASRATVSADGNVKEWSLEEGAQDQLSYLHQLSFLIADAPLPTVMVTNGRRFYSVKIEILGNETVATGLGPVNTLRVRGQLEGKSRIDVWLAPDYGNLPVKVRIRDHRGDELEQVLTAMRIK
ncbi:MAG TPA: DUF3108 domain-containing protein [Burkholderiales bacterium]|nr:DUF3108 domain-containing protein [Burkholderiales bacterium]